MNTKLAKAVATTMILVGFTAVGFGISLLVYPPNQKLHNYHQLVSVLDDEQYVVFRDGDKWSILTPSGYMHLNLAHREVGRFFYDGDTDMDNIFPSQTEYQLELNDDDVTITDNGRHVATIPLKDAGLVSTSLIADNE